MRKKRVLVFGVFDFLHPGHISFLKQARKRGSELIVVVARDSVVKKLKRKTPRQNESRRIAALRRLLFVAHAVRGDSAQGTYAVLRRWKPDVVCVGYDQDGLRKDLFARMRDSAIAKVTIIRLRPFAPHKFRSSLLRQTNPVTARPKGKSFRVVTG
ncbi:MAG: hypothetical protein A2847_03035 [Candidatus Sungbacteria bacterium RIFCSPHIGHO2_01_FULL_50_25]|uniref:Cytidyltransferase-like domain-containing protein n=1 Tax=Candidatus Sungbacteria bacterium RIFCSPHIGHO2_01_FULL_50_25 TaxID=1802265 RepID=A0A1G2K9D5_9BACT|nr:MAG: hypothetical protein A2847_03035 [Candidatus Sungbacteria bacterium RIFCSPHIGHO2_01_FULL_50_25]